MNEKEINIVSGKSLAEIELILKKFLKLNENTYNFCNFVGNNLRASLWTALFQHIQDSSAERIHAICLSTIRQLCRDKSELDNVICEKWLLLLIEKAGLHMENSNQYETVNLQHKDVVVEALKALCNLTYNSSIARSLCAQTRIAEALVARVKSYQIIPYKDDIMLYDMKLMFILTAYRHDIKSKIRDDLNGMTCILKCLNDIILEAPAIDGEVIDSKDVLSQCFLNDNQQCLICDILKVQFNLVSYANSDGNISDEGQAMYLDLLSSLIILFNARATTQEKLMDLHSNVTNLLLCVPAKYYHFLTWDIKEGEKAQYVFEGRNMNIIQSLLEFLQHKLAFATSTDSQYDNLSAILTVLNKCARECRPQRKYLRQVVLPPLRDVSQPPEQGNALRNQLCRLLTTPVTIIRDLVADFLFILCKEKVGRMVKYTGFGNAAGHLAQTGLLGGNQHRPTQYSSSSEDSDTEEYLEAQPRIDPVVGCTRPPRNNPFEGMSDEQKEFEAMKLVKLFDKMLSDGVVKPARVGPDGRPQPVGHVLELLDSPRTDT